MMHPPPLIPINDNKIKRHHVYELYAMIVHKGYADGGHYYSLIRYPSGNWFSFSDDDISLIKQDDKLL